MNIKGLHQNRGKWWRYQPPQVDGIRPPAISLGTSDERKAIELVLEIRAGEHLGASGTLGGEIKLFLSTRRRSGHQAESTTSDAERTLADFSAFLSPARSIGSITAHDVNRWIATLKAAGHKPNTITTYGGRVKAFFSHLVRAERLKRSPFRSITLPKPRRTKRHLFCTADERNRLITNCTRADLQFVLWCGFHAGMRRVEIDNARPEWFEWDAEAGTGQITITPGHGFQPKGLHRRIVPIPAPFVAFLESYKLRSPYMLRPEITKGANRYRWDIRLPWNEYTASQDLRWVTPHIMRHTYATLHVRAGTAPAVLAQWFGADLKVMLDVYTGYFPDQSAVNATI